MFRLLLSLFTILAVTGGAAGPSRAFLSDWEKSRGNKFIAGAIDLKIANECHWNNRVCALNPQDNTYYWGETTEECTCSWSTPIDLDGKAIFNFTDIKPGDTGEDTISLHVDTNPAWVCAEVTNIQKKENGCTEPEALADATCLENDPEELWDNLTLSAWRDTGAADHSCNNIKDEDETYLFENQKITAVKWPVADASTGTGPITDTCIGVSWSVPNTIGNEMQTDSVTGDITFYAYQARDNDNFLCYGPQDGTLIVKKIIDNQTGGDKIFTDFAYKVNGGSAVLFEDDGQNDTTVGAGTYTIVEEPVSNYIPTYDNCSNVEVASGQTQTCTITNTFACMEQSDVMLVLDRSASISGSEMTNMKNAAIAFMGALNPDGGVHMGQSSFSTTGTLDLHLTGDQTAIAAAINGISPSGFTNLYDGLTLATAELDDSNTTYERPAVPDIMIVVTDGNPNEPGTDDNAETVAANAADAARAAGIEIYVVGVGGDVDATYLSTEIADDAAHYYNIASYESLQAALADIAYCGNPPAPTPTLTPSPTATPTPAPITLLTDNFGTGNDDSSFNEAPVWTEGGPSADDAEKRNASGGGNDSASSNGGRFALIQGNGSWLCRTINTTGYNTIRLSYLWRGDSDAGSSSDDGIVEFKVGGNCSDGSGWTTLQNHDIRTDGSWTTQTAFGNAGFENANFLLRFRVATNDTSEDFRIDGVSLTGIPN